MSKKRRTIEWNVFWLREVVFLGIPVLFAVFTLPRGDTIHAFRLGTLLVVLLSLTVGNILWMLFGGPGDYRLPGRRTTGRG